MGCCCSKSSGSPSTEPGPRPVQTSTGSGQNKKAGGNGSLAWPSNLSLPSTNATTPSAWDTVYSYSVTPSPLALRSPAGDLSPLLAPLPRSPPSHITTPSSTGTVIRRNVSEGGPSRVHSSSTLGTQNKQRDPRQNRSDPYP
ncbi:uncharacterized protein PgNI_08954 [Pyricularia grisea]|uniref:Uncharacterized protein n=1 Tax=Pyricularia grisea TaxID=148305 RepID=A0A6P8AW66_PYRGI|nr:uncharacterized protein PgNI_08954 [Pyricularia grisea]TLD06435.1 hypothetical protein PgNI_08954 [Pyricularia grisea]